MSGTPPATGVQIVVFLPGEGLDTPVVNFANISRGDAGQALRRTIIG